MRAFAALIVVIGHIEIFKKNKSIPNLIDNNFLFFPSGHIAVVLFFVLSGFLITYLLVQEKNSSSISFKNFYLRRMLRIWPLYYLILLMSFLLFKPQVSDLAVFLSVTIFPNIGLAINEGWQTSPQIWSIGVEEQFYLFWPILLHFVSNKKIPLFILLFIVVYTILPHFIGFVNLRTFNNMDFNGIINRFFFGTKFNCMAIGAFMGFGLAQRKEYIQLLSNKYMVLIFTSSSILLWFLKFEFKYFTEEFFALLFSFMIVGLVVNPKVNIDTSISKFLGKISFGIYMYHWIVLLLVIDLIPYNGNNLIYNTLLYTAVVALTVLISWFSFNYYEKFFLVLKKSLK